MNGAHQAEGGALTFPSGSNRAGPHPSSDSKSSVSRPS